MGVCIPACTGQGCVSQHDLGRAGVCLVGVYRGEGYSSRPDRHLPMKTAHAADSTHPTECILVQVIFCSHFAFSLQVFSACALYCVIGSTPHLLHLLHSKRVSCRRLQKCKEVFDLFIERCPRLQKLLQLMKCSTILTGIQCLFHFQILLYSL